MFNFRNSEEGYLNLYNSLFVIKHTIYEKHQPSQKNYWTPKIKTQNTGAFRRCFTVDTPYVSKQAIEYLKLNVNKSVFESGFLSKFFTVVSYPNQLLRSGFTAKDNWISLLDENDENNEIILQVAVKSMRVINYRHRPDNPCHADWLDDDQKFTIKYCYMLVVWHHI